MIFVSKNDCHNQCRKLFLINIFKNLNIDYVCYRIFILGRNPPSELNLRPVFVRVPPPLYSCDDEVKILNK